MAGALATALPIALGIGAGAGLGLLLEQLNKPPGSKAPGGEKVDLTPLKLIPDQAQEIVDNTKKVKDTTGKVRNLYDELWAAQWGAKGTVINTTEAAKSTAKHFNINLTESLKVADQSGQQTAGSWLNLAGTSAAIAVTGLTIATVIEQFKVNIASAIARFGAAAQSVPNSFAIGLDHFGAQPAYASSGGGSKTSTISAASRSAINAKPNALGLKLAAGGSFIAGSPQFIKVGEAGAERVDVRPLGSRGSGAGGGMVVNQYINVAGSVWSTNELLAVIDNHRKRALRSRNIGV
jgi:hypothetical protein